MAFWLEPKAYKTLLMCKTQAKQAFLPTIAKANISELPISGSKGEGPTKARIPENWAADISVGVNKSKRPANASADTPCASLSPKLVMGGEQLAR